MKALNPYQASIRLENASRPFRFRVIPATLTGFYSFCQLCLGAIYVLGWLEYLESDRYDPTRPLIWTLMETSPVLFSLVAAIICGFSSVAWVRDTATKAVSLFVLSNIVFFAWMLLA